MFKFLHTSYRSISVLVIMLNLGFSTLAQHTEDNESAKDDQAAQQERMKTLLHMDEMYTSRTVSNSSYVHPLPQGTPIAAFSKGGEKEAVFKKFVSEQLTAGLLILQDGKIRMEYYALGHSATSRWTSLSVAKSVASTLLGAAIKDGYIKSVDDYVTEYIPDMKGSAYDSVKIRHLLTMTSGVKWNENYADPNSDIAKFNSDPVDSGVNATVSYMRKLPAEAKPGKKWLYKTGETHLIGELISAATGQTLSDYLSKKIWAPYGMESNATWILDRTGHEMAGCCLQARLRDFARFGQFVMEGGMITGESIVPRSWFQEATRPQVQLWPGGGYGYQWWVFSKNTFEALGIHGQMIHIDPERNLIVVINSAWPEADSNERHAAAASFIKTITQEIDKEKTNAAD